MEAKRIRIDDFLNKLNECCVCGEGGSLGMTNVFNLSLRENETVVSSFSEILEFSLGLKVQVGASDICANCKQKTIEFYHFKRRSHVKNKPVMMNNQIPHNISSLAQDSMRIVDMYIKKFSIKALRIEESDERLIIMRKPPNAKLSEAENQENELIPPFPIKQEQIREYFSSDILSVKGETESEVCVKIKVEPDLIIEDIGEDSIDSHSENSHIPSNMEPTPETSPPQENLIFAPKHTNSNQIELLLNMNQQIFQLVQKINSKFDNFEHNIGKIEQMYESDENFEPNEEILDLPENLKCETLSEVLQFNKILLFRENREKLEMILKHKLEAFKDNYKLLLKEGLNLLMSKPTQYLICHDGLSVLKASRGVKCLLKVTHEIFGTPILHIERYVYHQLFMKKSITAFS